MCEPYNYITLSRPKFKNFSIIIQGPLESDLQPLKKLIEEYSKIVDKKNIIISTSGINKYNEIYLKNEKITYVVVDKNPVGPKNMAVQSRSVLAGIESANTEFVLRTRNDQFISSWDFIDTYINSISDNKIFICGYTLKSPIFHVSDMLHFGKKNILYEVWSTVLKELEAKKLSQDIKNIIENELLFPGEIYIGYSLAKYYKKQINSEGYKSLLKENLIVASNQDIGLYWDKYNNVADFRRIGFDGVRGQIDHMYWAGII